MQMALTVELPKTRQQLSWTVRNCADALEQLVQPLGIAQALTEQLNYRVFHLGEPAQPFPGYKHYAMQEVEVRDRRGRTYKALRRVKDGSNQSARGYKVSPAYALATLGSDEQVWFESSKDFHDKAQVVPGTYFATGGMARGLQSRNFGTSAAIIEFGGSSLGSKSARSALTDRSDDAEPGQKVRYKRNENGRYQVVGRKLRRDENGKVRYRAKPVLIRNWIKASAIFHHHHVCILQHTDMETYDLCDALADHMRLTWIRTIPGNEAESVSYMGQRGTYYQLLRKHMGINSNGSLQPVREGNTYSGALSRSPPA